MPDELDMAEQQALRLAIQRMRVNGLGIWWPCCLRWGCSPRRIS